jgi:hypothetical protein
MAYTVVDKGSKYFNTVTWTGDSTTSRSITGVNFQPDFTWIKTRSISASHNLVNSVIGSSYRLKSNGTTAEEFQSENGYVSSFNSDGFTLAKGSSTDPTFTGWYETNQSGQTYVGWNWLGANTTVSNTSGTITSTVSANTTSGFSIVSYTGTGANATVGHGLGVAPKVVIVKKRSSGADDWYVNHTSASATAGSYLKLNSTQAVITGSASRWNNTNPTSTLFTIGTDAGLNGSGGTYIAYCFADVKGYSKFGSYTGNGSTDGTFVYTGFSPAFVMCKSSSGAFSWVIKDSKRPSYNPASNYVYAQSSNAEATDIAFDFLSNGFKTRATGSDTNGSGGTYIYMAFAENPFVSSKSIPCTAR